MTSIFDIQIDIIKYFTNVHNKNNNCVLLSLIEKISHSHDKITNYYINYPLEINVEDIYNRWLEYAIENLNINKLSLLSISSINVEYCFSKIDIICGDININPEEFIRKLCFDIIENLNIHLIEMYRDNYYDDYNDHEYNEVFNNTDMQDIYDIYPTVNILVPITLEKDNNKTEFFISGTIKTNFNVINIIDDIRECLESDDLTEIFNYEGCNIEYEYGNFKEIKFDLYSE